MGNTMNITCQMVDGSAYRYIEVPNYFEGLNNKNPSHQKQVLAKLRKFFQSNHGLYVMTICDDYSTCFEYEVWENRQLQNKWSGNAERSVEIFHTYRCQYVSKVGAIFIDSQNNITEAVSLKKECVKLLKEGDVLILDFEHNGSIAKEWSIAVPTFSPLRLAYFPDTDRYRIMFSASSDTLDSSDYQAHHVSIAIPRHYDFGFRLRNRSIPASVFWYQAALLDSNEQVIHATFGSQQSPLLKKLMASIALPDWMPRSFTK